MPSITANLDIHTLGAIPSPDTERTQRRTRHSDPIGLMSSITETILFNEEEKTARMHTKSLAEERLIPLTELHAERRITLFFLQVILCHKTNLTFFSGPACDQGKSSPPLHLIDGILERQSAHSSTVPCLYAKKGEVVVIFLKETDYYRAQNSTLTHQRSVNTTDMYIDFLGQGTLRKKTVKLLNQASSNTIDPLRALREFVHQFKNESTYLYNNTTNEAVRNTARIYIQVAEKARQGLQKNKEKFALSILGIYHTDQLSNRARSKLLKKTYLRIKKLHYSQSALVQKVDKIRQECLTDLTRGKKPPYFDPVFNTIIGQNLSSEEKLPLLQVFGNWEAYFQHQASPQIKGKVNKLKSRIEQTPQQKRIPKKELRSLRISFEKMGLTD